MRIQCFMPVFNEGDVLPYVLLHLRRQGVSDIHVIDGWSTDGSFEICREYGATVERFPHDRPSPVQCCRDILHRIEELAWNSDADWILYSDADEWRRSDVAGETLEDGVVRVRGLGFNAIDFRVFAFFCIDGAWHDDPEAYFDRYNETDIICRIPNRKLWKNTGQRVTLTGGGHQVCFSGLRQYPGRFVMKHYPFRTPAQAREKLETRLARRDQEEHAAGWGVHYDEPFPGTFCWDPAQLKRWPDVRTPLP